MVGGSEGSEMGGWVWQRRDRRVGLKEATTMRLVCRLEIVLASWLWGSVLASRRCRFVAKTMTVRWGWGLNLRHDQIGEGWAQLEIVLLGFEDGGFGIYDFFFNGNFMLNFMGLWIWFLGLWILFVGGFVVDWKMRKFGFELWFWYIWVLWFEKI